LDRDRLAESLDKKTGLHWREVMSIGPVMSKS
jgi:hypothetical protein